MKKLFTFLCTLFALSANLLAQVVPSPAITKFLGIPIDGNKYEMIRKLKEKGFTDAGNFSDADLVGEFNGTDVEISVVTDNNQVYRIAVFDRYYCDEPTIKIRFNNLCRQFENNSKYFHSEKEQVILDDDISYEIAVNSKRYEAAFYQHFEARTKYPEEVTEFLQTAFTQEQIDNPTEEEESKMAKMREEFAMISIIDVLTAPQRLVWFMIDYNEYGKYRILMFYDNKKNESNGQDL